MPDVVFALDSRAAITARHQEQIDRLRSLLHIDERMREALLTNEHMPVQQLIAFAGPIPASEYRHDADCYGLVRHSLLVTQYALESFHRFHPRPAARDQTGLVAWSSQQVAVVVLGVGHDLGKLWDLLVQFPGSNKLWNPGAKALLVDAEERHATEIAVSWKFPRSSQGPNGHEVMGAWLLPRIFSIKCLPWMSREHAADIMATMSKSLGARGVSDLYSLVHGADRRACSEADAKTRAQRTSRLHKPVDVPDQEIDPAHAPVRAEIGTISRAHDFLAAFRILANEPGPGKDSKLFTVNRFDGDLFISSTHTVICLPDNERSHSRIGPLRRIYEYIRGVIDTPDYSPAIKTFYTGGRPEVLVEALAAESDPRSGKPQMWALWTGQMAQNATGLPDIKHYVILQSPGANRRDRTTSCLVLPNEVLWGTEDPLETRCQGEPYSHPLAFLDFKKENPTLDPVEVGFVPMLRSTQAAARVARISGSLAQPSADDQIGTALDLARLLWTQIDRVAPLPVAAACTPSHLHWRQIGESLVRSPSAGGPDDLLMESLTAMTDRLVDVAPLTPVEIQAAAQVGSSPPPPAGPATPATAAPPTVAAALVATTSPPTPPATTPDRVAQHLLAHLPLLARATRVVLHPDQVPTGLPWVVDEDRIWLAVAWPAGARHLVTTTGGSWPTNPADEDQVLDLVLAEALCFAPPHPNADPDAPPSDEEGDIKDLQGVCGPGLPPEGGDHLVLDLALLLSEEVPTAWRGQEACWSLVVAPVTLGESSSAALPDPEWKE